MNPILTLLPAAGAAFAFFFSSLPVDDYDTSNGYGTLIPAYKAGVGPSNYEQQVQSNFAVPGRIAFAPIPGASSYALYSGAEFGLFHGQDPWIKSQLEEMNRKSPAPSDTFSVPSIPDIAQAIQIEGLPMRIAFQETSAADGSVPTPKKPAAETDTKTDTKTAENGKAEAGDKKKGIKNKYAERKNGRVMLTKALVFRGWQKNPEKQADDDKEKEKKDEESKADEKDDTAKTAPAPTPAPTPAPATGSELVIPPPSPVEP